MAIINLPGQTIGILGKGLMTERLERAAQERGYKTIVFSQEKNEDLFDFAGKANMLVFDSETVETDELQNLQRYIEIPQLSNTLSVTQDRLIEKVFLESLNINSVPYATITSSDDLKDAVNSIGFPCVLKPIRVEKNQPPNVMLYSEEDFKKTVAILRTGTCILDAWVPFDKELAVSYVRSKDGRVQVLPIVETVYNQNELRGVIAPAHISDEMGDAILDIGQTVTEAMALCGIVTAEFLVTAVGTIYLKRITTGVQPLLDYTMDATNISQYELFIRAVCGLPIPEVKMMTPVISYFVRPEQEGLLYDQMLIQADWYVHQTESGWLINTMEQSWQNVQELMALPIE